MTITLVRLQMLAFWIYVMIVSAVVFMVGSSGFSWIIRKSSLSSLSSLSSRSSPRRLFGKGSSPWFIRYRYNRSVGLRSTQCLQKPVSPVSLACLACGKPEILPSQIQSHVLCSLRRWQQWEATARIRSLQLVTPMDRQHAMVRSFT